MTLTQTLALVAMGLAVAGCGRKMITVTGDGTGDGKAAAVVVQERKLTDEQKFTLLRTEARKRGLKWKIICLGGLGDRGFAGWAVRKREPFTQYVEEGGKGSWWAVHSNRTQADAAYELYQAIQGNPDEPIHRKAKPECPPILEGE